MKLLKPLEIEDVPVQRPAEDERAAALGAAEARRAGQVHRVDRRRQAAPSGLSRAARRQEADGRQARAERATFGVRRSTVRRQRRAHARDAPDERRTPNRRTPNAEPRTRTQTSSISCRALEDAPQGRRARRCPDGEHAEGHQPPQGVLAEAEADQGRSVPLLRAGRAVHPAGRRRSAARHEALSERHRGAAVLSAPRARRAARRPHRSRRRRRDSGRRSSAAT